MKDNFQDLPSLDPKGNPWNDTALHAIGANTITYPDDENDAIVRVRPPVDLSKYDAAVREVAKAAERIKRDALLAACDWTQLPDAPLTKAQVTAWRTYRQGLRDFKPVSPPEK